MNQETADSQEGEATKKKFRRSQESTKKRGKEVVAAMPSFDIFLHLAILCFFTLRYTKALI